MDHTYYTNNLNSFIYDAIIPNNSDLCYALVKSNNMNEIETKIFVWEYIPFVLKTVFDFEGHIESIIPDPKNGCNLIFFNMYYLGMYQYVNAKRKIILNYKKEYTTREISDVTYSKSEQTNNYSTRIIVSFKNQTIEIFDGNLNTLKEINLLNIYKSLVKQYDINTDDEENVDDFLINKKIIQKKAMFCLEAKNKIIYIISRGEFLFIFFIDTPSFLILKKNTNSEDYFIYSIENFKKNVTEKSCFMINSSGTKIFALFGTSRQNAPHRLAAKYRHQMTRRSLIRSKNNGGETISYDRMNDEQVILHELEKKKICYSLYNVDVNQDLKEDFDFALELEKNGVFSPFGIYCKFEFDFLNYTSSEVETKYMAISVNPRMIILTNKSAEIIIFHENNSSSKNLFEHINSLNFEHEESLKVKLYDTNNVNSFLANENKPPTINYTHVLTKELEYEPVNISINPYGSYFFLAFEDSAFIYGILDKELKELYKISASCRGCSFSETGKYLAYSRTDFSKEEFDIVILDSRTFELEYIITNLSGHVTKIQWMDSDRIIVALIDEKDIFGWRLEENRVIYQSKEKFDYHGKSKKDLNNVLNSYNNSPQDTQIFRLIEYGEKIIDFCYDYVVDYLLLIGEEKKIKIFSENCEESWEFLIDCKYTCVLLIRRLDIIVFGTSEGSIRTCIWPIPNFTKKEQVDAPAFTEKFLHGNQIIQLYVSNDLKYLYSCSSNGSVFLSLLNSFCNESRVNLETFIYFDTKFIINKKMFSKYSDYVQFTEPIYKSKYNSIQKLEFDIQGMNIEFASEIDKINGENTKTLEDKKYTINNLIEKERRKVKNMEEEKEVLAKQLREKRENQIKSFKDEIRKMKKVYKQEKESLQNATKSLSNQIKEVKQNYSNYLELIENKKTTNESKLKTLLQNVLKNLTQRLTSIKKIIETKEETFRKKINELEDTKENWLREEEYMRKYKKEKNNLKILEFTNEIEKINKDNENHTERIAEWEKNLRELRENNADLMESFLFNTLKLKQMNKSLVENESKISDREIIVKEKRLINDRLEKLRFVLEYQIKNLIKERVPIQEQIKNFEELHNDFYQRFNLIYAEQLNIEDFITNNLNLIDNFKEELTKKKKTLYYLKNLLRALDTEISFIVRQKIDDKNFIIKKLEKVYKKYLESYFDPDSLSIYAQESKNQSKIMVKEIKLQKNKVMKDLMKKRKEMNLVRNQKDYLMLKIQAENTQLIEECSSIRLNLEDILKYINDIEKKFIELTNTHVFLTKNITTKTIKQFIKQAKTRIEEADIDKGKVAKMSEKSRNEIIINFMILKISLNTFQLLYFFLLIFKILGEDNKFLNTHHALGKKSNVFRNNSQQNKLNRLNKTNVSDFTSNRLLRQIELNREEMDKQETQMSKINKKIKDLIGIDIDQNN